MKRVTTTALILSAVLVTAVPAEAHKSRWAWTENYAERRLSHRYADVLSADCLGFGSGKRTRSGRWKYGHHSCGLSLENGSSMHITLTVLGRKRARIFFGGEAVDTIR